MEVVIIIVTVLFLFILLPIILYYLGHPILWLLYIILLIQFLPTLLFHHEILCRIRPYITHKFGKYDYFRSATSDILQRHFKVFVSGPEYYSSPVIFIVNHHEPGSYLDHFCLMKIKTRAKIVMYQRSGLVEKLFRNIEHIALPKHTGNRLPLFLEKCKQEIDQGTSIIIYPEGKYASLKSTPFPLQNFQTGAFVLACTYGIPIVPLLISGGNYKNGWVTYKPIKMKYLPLIDPKGYSPENLRDHCLKLMNLEAKYL